MRLTIASVFGGERVNCAECDATLNVPPDVIRGEIVSCPDCGSSYEVVGLTGGSIQLRPAEVEGEDWGE